MLSGFKDALGRQLDASSAALLALFVLVGWYVVSSVVAWHRLRKFPGPRSASFSYVWGVRAMWSGKVYEHMARAQRKYGDIVRVGPNQLMIADPDTLNHINAARSTYTRGRWYDAMRFDLKGDSILTEPDMTTHDKRKAKLASGYSGKGAMNLEHNIDIQLANLVRYLNDKVDGGHGVLDLSRVLRLFQVDLISCAGTREAWGDLRDDTDHHNYMTSIDPMFRLLHTSSMAPWLRSILLSRLFLRLFGAKPTDKHGMGRVNGYARFLQASLLYKKIDERFSKDPEKRETGDMLDEWMKHGLSAFECKMDMALQVPAGSDTSVTTIRGILLHLFSSPVIYRKLKDEISLAIDEDRISDPVTHEEAMKLPLLNAVILEGMRLSPATTVGFPKVVPPGGDMILGRRVPAGTELYGNMVMIGQNEKIFGSDIAVFRPERFLEGDTETRQRRMRTVDLGFGAGRWMCLGKALAQMEMRKLLVQLLRNFDFQIVNPEMPWKKKAFVVFLIDDFVVKVSKV